MSRSRSGDNGRSVSFHDTEDREDPGVTTTTGNDEDPSTAASSYEQGSVIAILQQDNESLRAMLRRALGAAGSRTEQSTLNQLVQLQTALDRKEDELRREKERRVVADSLLHEFRQDYEMYSRAKEAELRKLQDAVNSSRTEVDHLREKAKEDESIIGILKQENYRLNQLTRLKQPRDQGPPPHIAQAAAGVRLERLKKDCPSSARHIGQLPPALFKKAFLTAPPSTSSIRRNPSPSASTRASPAPSPSQVDAASRSRSPGSSTVAVALAAQRFQVGSRCTWRNLQGVVRYVGPVEGLGRGTFAGVELSSRGYGDHNGSLNGIQYFVAPQRSSVFCPLFELQSPKDAPTIPGIGNISTLTNTTTNTATTNSSRATPRTMFSKAPLMKSERRVMSLNESTVATMYASRRGGSSERGDSTVPTAGSPVEATAVENSVAAEAEQESIPSDKVETVAASSLEEHNTTTNSGLEPEGGAPTRTETIRRDNTADDVEDDCRSDRSEPAEAAPPAATDRCDEGNDSTAVAADEDDARSEPQEDVVEDTKQASSSDESEEYVPYEGATAPTETGTAPAKEVPATIPSSREAKEPATAPDSNSSDKEQKPQKQRPPTIAIPAEPPVEPKPWEQAAAIVEQTEW